MIIYHVHSLQSRGYRIQEKDRQRVVAMTWDDAGTTLLSAYSSGKLIKVLHFLYHNTVDFKNSISLVPGPSLSLSLRIIFA